jgi:hypothetical protein
VVFRFPLNPLYSFGRIGLIYFLSISFFKIEWNITQSEGTGRMKWVIEDRILHGMYEKKEGIPDEVLAIANEYEGKIPNRIGFNFPMSFVRSINKNHSILRYESDAEYVIVYRNGDLQTKRHELQHAKYGMKEEYRKEVKQLWDSLTTKERDRITAMLVTMRYPNREEILLDEFQAYYFTEKPNFFGSIQTLSCK